MRSRFDYRTCMVQNARITFVNGRWQGKLPPTSEDATKALNSCPEEWEYLVGCGADGWELVAATEANAGAGNYRMLYLRREVT